MRRVVLVVVLLAPGAVAGEREEALLRVKALAESFSQFEDKQVAADSLAILGYVACRYHKASAITILRQASSVLRDAELESAEYELLRVRLLRAANPCDAKLADELFPKTESPNADSVTSAKTALSSAFAQAREDSSRSAEIAGSMLGALPSMAHNDARRVALFVNALHTVDQGAAGGVFLQALAAVDASPDGALAALQAMGDYPFGAAAMGGNGSNYTSIGSVDVADLSARRPTVPDEMAVAYLRTAAGMVSRPVASQTEQTYRYTLAYQLATHAEALAPELAPVFLGVMEERARRCPDKCARFRPATWERPGKS